MYSLYNGIAVLDVMITQAATTCLLDLYRDNMQLNNGTGVLSRFRSAPVSCRRLLECVINPRSGDRRRRKSSPQRTKECSDTPKVVVLWVLRQSSPHLKPDLLWREPATAVRQTARSHALRPVAGAEVKHYVTHKLSLREVQVTFPLSACEGGTA